MNISVVSNIGMVADFAKAIGATVRGRFAHIPAAKGAGYVTGFDWSGELRMMIRNYHLNEDVVVEWTTDAAPEDNLVFLLSGILPSASEPAGPLLPESANLLICKQGLTSIISMPANTVFGSVTIRASRQYLQRVFGQSAHPVVKSVIEAGDAFVLEASLSAQIINAAGEMLHAPIPDSLESHYYKLKCEELLCYIFALLMQREAIPMSKMHITDIKAIYAVKQRLQSRLDEAPDIALLAKQAGMSGPKLRKLFRQTFGKGVFEYYQSARMTEAARLLREKRLSVSEAGYQMGFSNLSHFSRVFEQHIGMKPKKYSTN